MLAFSLKELVKPNILIHLVKKLLSLLIDYSAVLDYPKPRQRLGNNTVKACSFILDRLKP